MFWTFFVGLGKRWQLQAGAISNVPDFHHFPVAYRNQGF